MPLANNGSAVTSAASSTLAEDVDAAVRQVMWVVVSRDEDEAGHYAFSSQKFRCPYLAGCVAVSLAWSLRMRAEIWPGKYWPGMQNGARWAFY